MIDREIDSLKKNLEDQLQALDRSAIVAMTDHKGVITYVNDMFCALSGYSRQELMNHTHRVVNSGYHPREFFIGMWRQISKGTVWRSEICNRAKDGRLYWVDTTIIPFLSSEGVVERYVSIRYDVTDKKLAEQKLEEEQLRLLESEKMASIGLLASGIAHELGNPLGAIRGRLEMLEMTLEQENFDKTLVKSSVRKMIQNVDRMSRIIRSLKSYSRDGSKDPQQEMNLTQLIEDIVEVSQDRCRKENVLIKLVGFDQQVMVMGRETELGQVVVNIINNALDAIQGQSEPEIQIEMLRETDQVVVRFSDSGEGVPEGLITKIFDPFYTTKDVGKGTGLGLSISRSIIQSHGGELSYKREGRWTCFSVRLPIELF